MARPSEDDILQTGRSVRARARQHVKEISDLVRQSKEVPIHAPKYRQKIDELKEQVHQLRSASRLLMRVTCPE